MTREDIRNLALYYINKTHNLFLELATGVGKTKLAIDTINHLCSIRSNPSILILVAKIVHKNEWRKEFKKWGPVNSNNITIECYESFKKYKNTSFDIIVADECHRLSTNRLDILSTIEYKRFIGLSATIPYSLKELFNSRAVFLKCDIRDAIDNNILPEPLVYIIPLTLDNNYYKFSFTKFKKTNIVTQQDYYDNLTSLIEYYKHKFYHTNNERFKLLWLSYAGKRLRWLSEQKESVVLKLLKKYENHRTLTFCNNIEQAERLGKYNITSKNKDSINNLNMFNENKINHITSVNILNEGCNLTDCQVGIFCNLNSSEKITVQRIGRILRHKNPVLIIPFFKGTREEELVNKMLQNYNKNRIFTMHYA